MVSLTPVCATKILFFVEINNTKSSTINLNDMELLRIDMEHKITKAFLY